MTRVLECLPLRPNRLPPPTLPQASVSPPPWNQRGGGNTRLRWGGGGANSDDYGEKDWHSVYSVVYINHPLFKQILIIWFSSVTFIRLA